MENGQLIGATGRTGQLKFAWANDTSQDLYDQHADSDRHDGGQESVCISEYRLARRCGQDVQSI